MHFLDDSLFPENQEKVVITAAPYGPEWEPADFPEDIPVTMDQHVQQAVDCWEAGATVLHIHVRELDGKGSKRMSQFNELLRRLREAVPEMILQVGGSISFSPEGEDGDAKWLSDDTRHMLAELDPKPDQVTIAINTSQMNIVELAHVDVQHRRAGLPAVHRLLHVLVHRQRDVLREVRRLPLRAVRRGGDDQLLLVLGEQGIVEKVHAHLHCR